MAIVTREQGRIIEDSGVAILEYDYDDVSLLLRAIRVRNTTPLVVEVTAVKTTDPNAGRTVSRTYPANATTVQNIGTGAAARINITIDSRGRMDGVETAMRFVI